MTSTATLLLNYPEAVAGVLVSYGTGAILEDVGRSVCLIIRQSNIGGMRSEVRWFLLSGKRINDYTRAKPRSEND